MADFFDSWRSGGTGRGAYILTPRSNTEVPLSIDGLSTSGASDILFRVRNSTGTVLFSVDNSGNLTFAGSGIITVDQTVTGNLTVQGNTALGNSTSQDTLTVTAAATFAGVSTFTGNSTFNGLLTANNGITIFGSAIHNGQSTFNGNSDFTSDVTISNGANLILTGGTSSGKSLIRFQSAASNTYDTNLLHVSATTMTMGMIAGSTPAYAAANGPFIGLRGNTYSAVVTQRGNLFFGAGNPSTPATGEGEIRFTTGADVQRMVIDKGGVVYIPTPSTNRFVVGGTAALGGAGGSVATIIGNTTGVGVLALQNTTAANAGYAQLDLYNSSGTNVAGFGYGNTATIAATQDRTYFYTVAKDFHISTDSNTTRHFIVAATNGRTLFTNTVIGGTIGVSAQITGSGSGAGVLAAGKFSLLAGYTGTSGSFGVYAQNMSAGSAVDEFSNVQAANYGEYIATTAGTVVGQAGYASGGNKSYGGFFRAIIDKAGSVNIGVGGFASNGANTEVGGFFGLMNSAPTYTSAALICDNGVTTNSIFIARDNGTAVLTIADFGITTFAPIASTSGSPVLLTVTGPAHTTLAKNTEASDINFNLARTVQFATVDTSFLQQRAIRIQAPTYGFVAASTLGQAVTMSIEGAPLAGTNATFTFSSALKLAGWASNAASNATLHVEPAGIATSFGNMTSLTGISYSKAISVSLGDQTANLINIYGGSFGAITYTSTTNTRTVTGIVASLYVEGAPIASTNVTFSNLAYSLFVDSGVSRFDGAIIGNQGTDIASASTIVIPTDGNTFELTGTTAVNLITKTNYQDGHKITLIANENVTINHGTATSGSDITILLAGAANFSMTANDTLTLVLSSTTANGQAWREIARTVI